MLGIFLGRSYEETHLDIGKIIDGICRSTVKQIWSSFSLIMHPVFPTMGNVWKGNTAVVLWIYGHQCQHRPSICVGWLVCVMNVLSECKCTLCMWYLEVRQGIRCPGTGVSHCTSCVLGPTFKVFCKSSKCINLLGLESTETHLWEDL